MGSSEYISTTGGVRTRCTSPLPRTDFDEDRNVRLGLAEDMNTPKLLYKLLEGSNPYVSCRAEETKEMILSRGQPHPFDCHRLFRRASKCAVRLSQICIGGVISTDSSIFY